MSRCEHRGMSRHTTLIPKAAPSGLWPLGSSCGAIWKDLRIVQETLEIQVSASNLPVLK